MFDFLQDAKEVMRARADIAGESINGKAEFVEYAVGTGHQVYIKVEVEGDPKKLTPGKHAVHIHEKGDCSDSFMCAGGHFDPGPAANTDPDVNHPFHAGDLPNIVISEEGKGVLEAFSNRFTLKPGPQSILAPDAPEGTALMIHANEDPYTSGPHKSGVSGGPRLACGVVKKV